MAKRNKEPWARANRFERRVEFREVRKDILVACEGSETEPRYFLGLAAHLRLSNVRARQISEKSTPKEIVRAAFAEVQRKPEEYEAVFCVYDLDIENPDMVRSATDAAQFAASRRLQNGIPFRAIASTPCFEFWLLSHFRRSDRPYLKGSSNSVQAQLLRELRKYVPTYQKSMKELFESVHGRNSGSVQNAITNSKWLTRTGCTNPRTAVYEVVEYLIARARKA